MLNGKTKGRKGKERKKEQERERSNQGYDDGCSIYWKNSGKWRHVYIIDCSDKL